MIARDEHRHKNQTEKGGSITPELGKNAGLPFFWNDNLVKEDKKTDQTNNAGGGEVENQS